MREIIWTPDNIAVGERVDGLLVLVMVEPLEQTTITLARSDAHRIGSELVKAAALTADELAALEPPLRDDVLL